MILTMMTNKLSTLYSIAYMTEFDTVIVTNLFIFSTNVTLFPYLINVIMKKEKSKLLE